MLNCCAACLSLPVRLPVFEKGTGGMVFIDTANLTARSTPRDTLFRHLYDLGAIDFAKLWFGGIHNSVVWGKQLKRGFSVWHDKPAVVDISTWLPVFLGGIQETQVRCCTLLHALVLPAPIKHVLWEPGMCEICMQHVCHTVTQPGFARQMHQLVL